MWCHNTVSQVKLISKENDDWWKVENKLGQQGSVPSKHFQHIECYDGVTNVFQGLFSFYSFSYSLVSSLVDISSYDQLNRLIDNSEFNRKRLNTVHIINSSWSPDPALRATFVS